MTRVVVIVLANTETHGDLARAVNAMMTATEFAESGDDGELMFDGAGTQWPNVLADPDLKSHRRFEQVHVRDPQRRRPPAGGVQGAPSVRRLVEEGRQVLTF